MYVKASTDTETKNSVLKRILLLIVTGLEWNRVKSRRTGNTFLCFTLIFLVAVTYSMNVRVAKASCQASSDTNNYQYKPRSWSYLGSGSGKIACGQQAVCQWELATCTSKQGGEEHFVYTVPCTSHQASYAEAGSMKTQKNASRADLVNTQEFLTAEGNVKELGSDAEFNIHPLFDSDDPVLEGGESD